MNLTPQENTSSILEHSSAVIENNGKTVKKHKRHSLNEMVMGSLAALQEQGPDLDTAATARDITDYILENYQVEYPIQTIIVVLNRLVKKGVVTRVANSGNDVRHRYCFYLNQSPQELREERIYRRFKDFAEEFFQGDLQLALYEVQKLVANSHQVSPSSN